MRKNKFMAGCVAFPSAVCASVCGCTSTSSADDTSFSAIEYLNIIWGNPQGFFGYYWWYIWSLIKGFDKDGVKSVLSSSLTILDGVLPKKELCANLFSYWRNLKNMELMTEWYAEIMGAETSNDVGDFYTFVSTFYDVVNGDFAKCKEPNFNQKKIKILENIIKWSGKRCSGEFSGKLIETANDFLKRGASKDDPYVIDINLLRRCGFELSH